MLNRPTYTLNPQDVGQKRGIGISILFNNGTNIFNQTFTTKEQVKSNLINYILTNKGERFYYPQFGGDLRASLFEPTPVFDSVAARLEKEIIAYVPNIIIDNVSVKKYPDENLVNISISYSISNQPDTLVINVSTTDLTNQY
jgi:phage baseplate assembly protein W